MRLEIRARVPALVVDQRIVGIAQFALLDVHHDHSVACHRHAFDDPANHPRRDTVENGKPVRARMPVVADKAQIVRSG